MAKLAAYHAKRDFQKTPEPREGGESGGYAFVVQKHDATRLHYDLRLELDGVMKSWAVTKGPSLVPGDKRLSVHTEDHPIAYNAFEGTIPKGQYGGGTVLLWDRGRWEPEGDPHRGYAKGHLNFRLHGEKLHGAWHLVRMRKRAGEKQEPWLLIKSEDEFARAPEAFDVLDELPLSVATGRTLEAIASEKGGAVWESNRGEAAEAGLAKPVSRKRAAIAPPKLTVKGAKAAPTPAPALAVAKAGGRKAPMPHDVEPCLATLAAAVPRGDKWVHEIKWDGYRLIASKARGKARLATRNGHDWTARFPPIAEALAGLPVETAILDGEAVVEDANGVSSFSALQAALSDEGGRIARSAIFHAFDLLYLDGFDLRSLPLEERKARLAALVPAGGTGTLRLSEHLAANGEAMVRSACRLGLEGVISKRRDRPYRSGRGEDWLKVKCTERQEFVIAGFVPSAAAKRAIGSLILGYQEAGALRYAGRAGTGYTAEAARDLWKRLEPTRAAKPPVSDKLTAEERRGAVWVEPNLVAEVEFRGWTGDDRLRHAAFKGLRDDKAGADVVRERPAAIPEAGAPAAPPKTTTPKRALPARSGSGSVAGVPLTHPERVLWAEGVTKQGLAEFYEAIASWLLPHVVDRPLSLVRCPNGAGRGCFFQKHSWAGLSDAILRETVRDEGGQEEVLYVRDIRGVIALVQASVLEIHPWGSRIADVDRPDRITMDLDPGDGVAWADIVAAAENVRERLAADGLQSFVKTTGGKGLHVVVPLTGKAGWVEVKSYAHRLALAMERDSPGRFIAKSTKAARRGLIYVDYLRNGRGATAIAAFSTRARPGATISTPLDWSELSLGIGPDHFTVTNLSARLDQLKADPWGEIGGAKQSLPQAPTRTPRAARSS